MKVPSRFPGFLLASLLLLAAPAGAHGQVSGDGYLFRRPAVTLNIHGGLAMPDAGSDLFDFVERNLTLERGDFRSYAAGLGFAASVGSRATVGLDVTYSGRTSRSEYRDWVEEDDSPITQSTNFVRIPVVANVRYYLTPRGRQVGNYAWIPARLAGYVGAGAGVLWYRFRQSGDFVDYEDLSIYTTTSESAGWARAAQAVAGLDYSISPRLVLNGELRYARSSADLDFDFDGFDPIDLSGFSGTLGLSFRF